MEPFGRTDSEIRVEAGSTFEIGLDTIPGSGYMWVYKSDQPALKLVSQSFRDEPSGIGAGCKEVFEFEALSPCDDVIVMQLQRAWKSEPLEEVRFALKIEPS